MHRPFHPATTGAETTLHVEAPTLAWADSFDSALLMSDVRRRADRRELVETARSVIDDPVDAMCDWMSRRVSDGALRHDLAQTAVLVADYARDHVQAMAQLAAALAAAGRTPTDAAALQQLEELDARTTDLQRFSAALHVVLVAAQTHPDSASARLQAAHDIAGAGGALRSVTDALTRA